MNTLACGQGTYGSTVPAAICVANFHRLYWTRLLKHPLCRLPQATSYAVGLRFSALMSKFSEIPNLKAQKVRNFHVFL